MLLGLELVTGSFALMPLPWLDREASGSAVLINWGWVFIGNLIGSVAYGALLAIALTNMGTARAGRCRGAHRPDRRDEDHRLRRHRLRRTGHRASSKRCCAIGWSASRVVLAMTTTSTIGKIACAWMPIFIFFAQGFEHSVVNMFIIPTGMMMGAKVTVADWWLWNQIPVTLGNLVGGFTFTGLAIYMTYKPRSASTTVPAPTPSGVPAE